MKIREEPVSCTNFGTGASHNFRKRSCSPKPTTLAAWSEQPRLCKLIFCLHLRNHRAIEIGCGSHRQTAVLQRRRPEGHRRPGTGAGSMAPLQFQPQHRTTSRVSAARTGIAFTAACHTVSMASTACIRSAETAPCTCPCMTNGWAHFQDLPMPNSLPRPQFSSVFNHWGRR